MNKSWTKYGGGRYGNEAIYNDNEWYCQSCQKLQTVNEVCFNHYYDGDYLRVCAQCAGNDCQPLQLRTRK